MTKLEKITVLLTLVLTLGFCGYFLAKDQETGEFIVTVERSETPDPLIDVQEEVLEDVEEVVVITFPINLNTATALELMELPGIGEKRAEDILSYRDSVGAFQSLEEIMKVSGIGEGIFTDLQELITLSTEIDPIT